MSRVDSRDLPALLADPRHQAWLAGHRAHRQGAPREWSVMSEHPACWLDGYDASARTRFAAGEKSK